MYPVKQKNTADIRRVVDELFDPSADGGQKETQITYESLSLLCGGGDAVASGFSGGGGGGGFVQSEAFVERLSFKLAQQGRNYQKVRNK